MNKLLHPVIFCLAILLIGTMLFSGCITIYKEGSEPPSPSSSQSTSQSAGLLSEVTTCKSYDAKTGQSIDKTSVFSTNSPVVYCTFKVSNAPPGTEVKIQWFYVKGEQKDMENSMVYEQADKFNGTQAGMFGLNMPPTGFPKGDYSARLLVNGKQQLSVPFSVQGGAAAAPAGKVTLTNLLQKPGIGYTIMYPADWSYEEQSNTFIFRGKKDTPANSVAIITDNIASSKTGGKYDSIDAIISDLKNIFKSTDANARIYNEKAVTGILQDGQQLNGKEITADYVIKGIPCKQLVVIVARLGGEGFSRLTYDSTASLYDTYLPVVQAMANSWKITK